MLTSPVSRIANAISTSMSDMPRAWRRRARSGRLRVIDLFPPHIALLLIQPLVILLVAHHIRTPVRQIDDAVERVADAHHRLVRVADRVAAALAALVDVELRLRLLRIMQPFV